MLKKVAFEETPLEAPPTGGLIQVFSTAGAEGGAKVHLVVDRAQLPMQFEQTPAICGRRPYGIAKWVKVVDANQGIPAAACPRCLHRLSIRRKS